MTSLLGLGYARPLEATDLYRLQSERGAAVIADKITESFARRAKIANEYNEMLTNGKIKPGIKALWWTILGNRKAKEKKWRDETGRKKPSIVLAMNDSIKWWFWSAGLFKVAADTAQITSPLVVKVRLYCFRLPRPLINIQRLSLILPLNHSQISNIAYLFQASVRGLDLFSYYSFSRLSHPSAWINAYIEACPLVFFSEAASLPQYTNAVPNWLLAHVQLFLTESWWITYPPMSHVLIFVASTFIRYAPSDLNVFLETLVLIVISGSHGPHLSRWSSVLFCFSWILDLLH